MSLKIRSIHARMSMFDLTCHNIHKNPYDKINILIFIVVMEKRKGGIKA